MIILECTFEIGKQAVSLQNVNAGTEAARWQFFIGAHPVKHACIQKQPQSPRAWSHWQRPVLFDFCKMQNRRLLMPSFIKGLRAAGGLYQISLQREIYCKWRRYPTSETNSISACAFKILSRKVSNAPQSYCHKETQENVLAAATKRRFSAAKQSV